MASAAHLVLASHVLLETITAYQTGVPVAAYLLWARNNRLGMSRNELYHRFVRAPGELAEVVAQYGTLALVQRTLSCCYVVYEPYPDSPKRKMAFMENAAGGVAGAAIRGKQFDTAVWAVTAAARREWTASELWAAALEAFEGDDTRVLDMLRQHVRANEEDLIKSVASTLALGEDDEQQITKRINLVHWLATNMPQVELSSRVLVAAAEIGVLALVKELCSHPSVQIDESAFVRAMKGRHYDVLRHLFERYRDGVGEHALNAFIRSQDEVVWAIVSEFGPFDSAVSAALSRQKNDFFLTDDRGITSNQLVKLWNAGILTPSCSVSLLQFAADENFEAVTFLCDKRIAADIDKAINTTAERKQ